MPFRTSSINATMPLSYDADEPPKKYSTHPLPPPSLSSLPDDIVLRCLALVPRSYHLSLSWVSKNLRSLVRSPELRGLRSIPQKSSLNACFQEYVSRCGASVEGKLYMVEYEETSVYNPRECEGERMVHMVSQRLEKGGRKDRLNDTVDCLCVVDDVLFAFVRWNGIMWFDTKLSVWRRLVGRDGKQLPFVLHETAMAEHDGRLEVLWDGLRGENEVDNTYTKNV